MNLTGGVHAVDEMKFMNFFFIRIRGYYRSQIDVHKRILKKFNKICG